MVIQVVSFDPYIDYSQHMHQVFPGLSLNFRLLVITHVIQASRDR